MSCRVLFLGLLLASSFISGALVAAEPKTGEQIYQAQCVRCHGKQGEGTDAYKEPLLGDRSVKELADIISRTMPEDKRQKCVGEDARKVAEYIHDAFYSPIAQTRNKPLRVELSRLTVRQYQQVMTDLVGSFRADKPLPKERGLKAEYFKGRRFSKESRVIERIDPDVNFDFGTGAPEPEKFDPYEFSIRWEGSLLAPETAEYEIIVKSDHAMRLWLNDLAVPFLDAYVRSGNDKEFRASIKLLGGRAYPLKLEFSKAKQGVDDSKKNSQRPVPPAAVALQWRLPQRSPEVIPQRFLIPQRVTEGFVCTVPFPPDDRSIGYERGTAINKAWDQATTAGALELSDYVVAKRAEFAGVPDSNPEFSKKLQAFITKFTERAFRRPLTDEQKQLYISKHFMDGIEPELALKRSLLLILKSPRFLYRDIIASSDDPFDVASRLSFGLWDSIPDAELLRAATAGELKQASKVNEQATRMVNDPRTKAKLKEFFQQWLKIDQLPDLAKDAKEFAEFTPEVANDLRTSLELFVDQVVWSDASDFRQLLLADAYPMNDRLAKFYGLDMAQAPAFQPLPLDPQHRAGVLTHPYLLANFAYTSTTSPIHRGVFISRSILGRALKTPPVAVAPLAPELSPDLTTRQRIELQTKAEACHLCHAMINPLGFTLENFDAVGRFREKENGKPVDSSGKYLTRTGDEVRFKDVRELANFLANSEETQGAFVEQMFHFLIKQPIRAYGAEKSAELQSRFRENQYSIRRLLADIVSSVALPPTKSP